MLHDSQNNQTRWPLGDLVSIAIMLAGLVLLGTCFILT